MRFFVFNLLFIAALHVAPAYAESGQSVESLRAAAVQAAVTGNTAKAAELLKEALILLPPNDMNNQRMRLIVLFQHGAVAVLASKYAAAEQSLSEAISIADLVAGVDKQAITRMLLLRAKARVALGDFKGGTADVGLATKRFEENEIKSPDSDIDAIISLAGGWAMLGNAAQVRALINPEFVKEQLRHSPDYSIQFLSKILPLAYLVGNYNSALDWIDVVDKTIRIDQHRAALLMMKAQTVMLMGDLDTAYAMIKNAHDGPLKTYIENNGSYLSNFGALLEVKGQLTEAIATLESALGKLPAYDARVSHGRRAILRQLSVAYLKVGDSKKALESLDRALFEIEMVSASPADEALLRIGRAVALCKDGVSINEAEAAVESAYQWLAKPFVAYAIAGGDGSRRAALTNSRYLLGELLECTYKLNAARGESLPFDRTFRISQLMVAGGFARGMSARQLAFIAPTQEAADLASEFEMLNRISAPQEFSIPDVKQAAGVELQVGARRKVVQAALRTLWPAFSSISEESILDQAQVKTLLKDKEALLLMNKTPQAVWVWVVTNSTAHISRLPIDEKLFNKNVSAVFRATRPDTDINKVRAFPLAAAHGLYSQTFLPVETFLQNAEHLLIAATPELLSIPWAALPRRLNKGAECEGKSCREVDWVVRKHTLTVLPAINTLSYSKLPASSSVALLGVGNPVFDSVQPSEKNQAASLNTGANGVTRSVPQFDALPETAAELQALVDIANDPGSKLLLGKYATKRALESIDFNKFGYLAFATHALRPFEYVGLEESALVLSSNFDSPIETVILKSSDILRWRLENQIVMLSACNTARADSLTTNEAHSGLVRAMLLAGARGVIGSLWPIESQSASELTPLFLRFHKMKNIDTPLWKTSDALRRAMLSMIDHGKHADYAHPFYWAPYVLVGSGV